MSAQAWIDGIGRALNEAARDLPVGWELHLVVEKGAGWVDLINPNGDEVPIPITDDLSEDIRQAVATAEASQ